MAGVSIISTKAISRKDHITIDTFYVIDPGGGVVTGRKSRETFRSRLDQALIEDKDLLPEIHEREARIQSKSKSKDMLPAPFPPSVDVYHELSLKQTIIEVHASDCIGLLYQLSRLIAIKGFDISFARIATERGVAMDTFYIKNVNDSEESGTTALMELRSELDAILKH